MTPAFCNAKLSTKVELIIRISEFAVLKYTAPAL